MKFISLFAGVGGFDLALERSGHECVYANEWDKYCKIIYDKHFCKGIDGNKDGGSKAYTEQNDASGQGLESTKGQTLNNSQGQDSQHSNSQSEQRTSYYDYRKYGLDTRSITDVTTDEIPDHDLLVGGFPCQSFSIAGKRGGFSDTRGTMFFEIARILQAKKPRLFILENVKGLLSHDQGNTFKTIISTLDELGYDTQWQVLNSKNFGVPQNRERVFIIGHLRGTCRPKVFPFTDSNSKAPQQLLGGSQGNRVYHPDGTSVTLASQAGGQGAKTGLYAMDTRQMTRESVPRISDNVPTLNATMHKEMYKVSDGVTIRRLTPTECERLQGFPDGWTEGVSDTQRYKMMGNAVTVNVVEYLIKTIK